MAINAVSDDADRTAETDVTGSQSEISNMKSQISKKNG